MNLTRRPLGCMTGLVIAMVLTTAAATTGDEPQNPQEGSIVALMRERQSVLSQLVEHQTAAYRMGEADIETVIQAHQDHLLAQLELAGSLDERITLLERSVELARELEEIAEAKHRTGEGVLADVLKSRADRLRVEIDLLRERRTER